MFLLLPIHIVEDLSHFDKDEELVLIEHPRYFSDFNFHVQKIILHRSTMRFYYDYLISKGFKVRYIEYNESEKFLDSCIHSDVHVKMFDPVDKVLETEFISKLDNITVFNSPLFLNTEKDNEHYFQNKRVSYVMHSFYIEQRKRLHILVDKNNNPIGGKWSFDSENRKNLKKAQIDSLYLYPEENTNHYIDEAKNYVNGLTLRSVGAGDNFIYPITFDEARQWLSNFLTNRLQNFGTYEDAMRSEGGILYHSLLSPLLNIGLLSPKFVIEEIHRHFIEKRIAVNNVEGLVRQLIGWREFVRGLYVHVYKEKDLFSFNFFKQEKELGKNLYLGKTGLLPYDSVVTNVIRYAYCHHIERLMILGTLHLLTECHPYSVYVWFMEMFIDSYDWVMMPNVIGMSQFADGGIFATKPYMCSANYIRKMSNYSAGEWEYVWTGLYWRFIAKHKDILSHNVRFSMNIKVLEKMSIDTYNKHISYAENFLSIIK